MTQVVKLLHWMAMGMENSGVLGCYYFVDLVFYWFDELRVLDWRVCRYLFLGLWCGINVKADDGFDPFFKLGHFLPWKLISASWNVNGSIIIQNELSILESPSVILKPLLFVSDILRAFDFLFLKNRLQLVESLHFGFFYFIKQQKIPWCRTILILKCN